MLNTLYAALVFIAAAFLRGCALHGAAHTVIDDHLNDPPARRR